MMIYCARITAIGLFVADGLTDKMLNNFDSNGLEGLSLILLLLELLSRPTNPTLPPVQVQQALL